VTALELEEIQPDISIAELEKRWGISRNALKARAKALGIELQRKGPTLTTWPGDRVADGDRLHAHCKEGGSLASFPGAVSVTPQASSDSSQLAVTPGLSLTPQGVTDSSQLAVLAAALAGAMPSPPADPLQRARGLAETADAGLVLTATDLGALLGHGVTSWRDGHLAYGYRFSRHKQGTQVLWTVTRAVTAAPDTTQTPPARSVGFLAEPPVAARQTINVSAVALPGARQQKAPAVTGAFDSEQLGVSSSPSRFCCLFFSDELMAAGDGGGNLAISDLRLAL
jgi:hypothetical protein